MFDEYDEVSGRELGADGHSLLSTSALQATALMPAEPKSANTPSEIPFMALDEDGMDLPSDWYLLVMYTSFGTIFTLNSYPTFSRICGLASNALKSGQGLPSAFPLQALMAADQPALSSKMTGLNLQDSAGRSASATASQIEEGLGNLMPPAQLSNTDRYSAECETRRRGILLHFKFADQYCSQTTS